MPLRLPPAGVLFYSPFPLNIAHPPFENGLFLSFGKSFRYCLNKLALICSLYFVSPKHSPFIIYPLIGGCISSGIPQKFIIAVSIFQNFSPISIYSSFFNYCPAPFVFYAVVFRYFALLSYNLPAYIPRY